MRRIRITIAGGIMMLFVVQGSAAQLNLKHNTNAFTKSCSEDQMQLASTGTEVITMPSGYVIEISETDLIIEQTEQEDTGEMISSELAVKMEALKSAHTPAQVALAIITLMVAIVVFIANQK